MSLSSCIRIHMGDLSCCPDPGPNAGSETGRPPGAYAAPPELAPVLLTGVRVHISFCVRKASLRPRRAVRRRLRSHFGSLTRTSEGSPGSLRVVGLYLKALYVDVHHVNAAPASGTLLFGSIVTQPPVEFAVVRKDFTRFGGNDNVSMLHVYPAGFIPI